jgi:hypothetical protein
MTLDIPDLLLCARLCNIAYVDSPTARRGAVADLGLTYLADYETADHRAILAAQGARVHLVLCGTRFSDGNWHELIDDEDLLPVAVASGARVMQGFYAGMGALYAWASTMVHGPLTIAGHSLGGARAHLAPLFVEKGRIAQITSFGAPKCGDAAYWSSVDTPLVRVVHAHDCWAAWPFISEFCQPSPFLWLHGGAAIETQESVWFGNNPEDHAIDTGYCAALASLSEPAHTAA